MTDTREQLITRVTNSFGPASDGGQLATNTALAQRLVAALLELQIISAAAPSRSTEQDQPKKEDVERRKPRDPVT